MYTMKAIFVRFGFSFLCSWRRKVNDTVNEFIAQSSSPLSHAGSWLPRRWSSSDSEDSSEEVTSIVLTHESSRNQTNFVIEKNYTLLLLDLEALGVDRDNDLDLLKPVGNRKLFKR